MSEQTNQEEREFTEKEIAEYRQKTLKHYAEQKKFLTLQCDVEELRARINKAKFESFEYTVRLAQLSYSMEKEGEESEEENTDSPKAETELKAE